MRRAACRLRDHLQGQPRAWRSQLSEERFDEMSQHPPAERRRTVVVIERNRDLVDLMCVVLEHENFAVAAADRRWQAY